MTTITVPVRIYDGVPDFFTPTHLVFSLFPEEDNEWIYMPILRREWGDRWERAGYTGRWEHITTELPVQFEGMRLWDYKTQSGDFQAWGEHPWPEKPDIADGGYCGR